MHRRLFLKAAAAIAAVYALPQQALAAMVRPDKAFTSNKVRDVLMQLYGTADYASSDALNLKAPEIAENGAVVPLDVSTDGAVKNIAVIVEENPAPLAAYFELGPQSVSHVATRIKMGSSSMVLAVAQTADGKLIGTEKEVKVTIGGCGG